MIFGLKSRHEQRLSQNNNPLFERVLGLPVPGTTSNSRPAAALPHIHVIAGSSQKLSNRAEHILDSDFHFLLEARQLEGI